MSNSQRMRGQPHQEYWSNLPANCPAFNARTEARSWTYFTKVFCSSIASRSSCVTYHKNNNENRSMEIIWVIREDEASPFLRIPQVLQTLLFSDEKNWENENFLFFLIRIQVDGCMTISCFFETRPLLFTSALARYREWSIKPPEAYLSKWLLRVGAYSGEGLFREWRPINFCFERFLRIHTY